MISGGRGGAVSSREEVLPEHVWTQLFTHLYVVALYCTEVYCNRCVVYFTQATVQTSWYTAQMCSVMCTCVVYCTDV